MRWPQVSSCSPHFLFLLKRLTFWPRQTRQSIPGASLEKQQVLHEWFSFLSGPPWAVVRGAVWLPGRRCFLVRPHQTLSWGEQRRWWHPFLLFRFSESSLAKASQNTARVGGRGTLLGVKKVTAEASSSLQIYSGCVHFFMSSVYTESGPCFDSGRTPAVASPLVSLNPLLSPPNSSQNYILKMQILFFTSQDSKIFFFNEMASSAQNLQRVAKK